MFLNMLAEGWGTDIVNLFTNSYYIVCLVCLAIGLILCAIECFVPGFGVFGIVGIIFSVFSIVFLLVMNGTWRQFLFMLGISIVIIVLVVVIAVRSARFGALSKSPLVQTDTALPEDYSSNESNYSFLLGKVGKTLTTCKPIGKVIVDGVTYSVITDGEYIEKDKEVYVSEVDGASITIKEIENKGNKENKR